MQTEDILRNAEILLEEMQEAPDVIQRALPAGELEALVRRLGALSTQVATVRSDQQLLAVANDVHRMIEERPALCRLLLGTDTDVTAQQQFRTMSFAQATEAAGQNAYAQQYAPQIANRLIIVREELEKMLRAEPSPNREQK